MVIYQATNQSCSPKAVSEAHSPEKRCSHLDIHKGKKAEKEKKRPTPPAIGGFIWILRRREEQEDEIQGQREPAERREMAAQSGGDGWLGYLCQ